MRKEVLFTRRRLGVVVIISALVCVAMGFDAFGLRTTESQKSSTSVTKSSVIKLGTPLWSIRRAPQSLIDAVGAVRLQSSIDSLLAGTNSCFIVQEDSTLRAQGSTDVPLIPASTQKLFTGLAALEVLGADSKIETAVTTEGTEVTSTVPNLFLVGAGDPLLATADFRESLDKYAATRGIPFTSLESLADQIKAAGVKKVSNGIVADDTRYDDARFVIGWKDSYRSDGQIGPIGALTVNRGFEEGSVSPVDDPALFAAEMLTKLLKERGVTVGGTPRRGRAPDSGARVASVSSATLSEIVQEMLRSSDNLAAEMLTREIGVRVSKEGTTAAGTAAIISELGRLGVDTTDLVMADGSGLGRGNRARCRPLLQVIDLGSRPEFSAVLSGLPIAGETGTLTTQFRQSALTGRLRAKTGSLAEVTGLAGLINVNRSLRFSLLINGQFTETVGIDLRSQVAEAMGAFPDAPGLESIVPAPVGT